MKLIGLKKEVQTNSVELFTLAHHSIIYNFLQYYYKPVEKNYTEKNKHLPFTFKKCGERLMRKRKPRILGEKRNVSIFVQIPGAYLIIYLCQIMPEGQIEKDRSINLKQII